MIPVKRIDPSSMDLTVTRIENKKEDIKAQLLGAQFFAALKAEDVPASPLRRTPTLRVTPQEWSDIMASK